MRNKRLPDALFLDDLKLVAVKLGSNSVRITDYEKNGYYNPYTIIRRFGTWNNALRSAGLNVKISHYESTNQDMLIAEIKAIAAQLGTNILTSNTYLKHGRYDLYLFKHHFGSWNNAILKAGLTITKRRYKNITEDQLILDLKAAAGQVGINNLSARYYKENGSFTIEIIIKHFGSWANAIEKAGMIPTRHRRYPDGYASQIIEDLKKIATASGVKAMTAKNYQRIGKFPVVQVLEHFYTWSNAMDKAGLTTDKFAYGKITDQELIDDFIRVTKLVGNKKTTRKSYADHGSYPLKYIDRRFGGLNGIFMKTGSTQVYGKIPDQALINDLLAAVTKTGKNTLTAEEYKKFGTYSNETQEAHFGNWNNALRKAGISLIRNTSVSPRELLDNLDRMCARLGRMPHYSEMVRPVSDYSRQSYRNHFGSFKKAIEQYNEYKTSYALQNIPSH